MSEDETSEELRENNTENIIKDAKAIFAIENQNNGLEDVKVPVIGYYELLKALEGETEDGFFGYVDDIDLQEVYDSLREVSKARDELDIFYRESGFNEPFRTLLKHPEGPGIAAEKLSDEEESLCIYMSGAEVPEDYNENCLEEIEKALENGSLRKYTDQ